MGVCKVSLMTSIRAELPGLFSLSVPIVASLAASTLLGVTDSVMLAPLGPVPLAAVGLTGGIALIFFAAIGMVFVRHDIAGAITNDRQVAALAAAFLLMFSCMQIADGVQSTMLGALRGMSDTGYPAQVSLLAYWVVALPLGWVLAGWVGPVGIWAGFFVALIGAGAALTRRFWLNTA